MGEGQLYSQAPSTAIGGHFVVAHGGNEVIVSRDSSEGPLNLPMPGAA
jgi:hypothetical protein